MPLKSELLFLSVIPGNDCPVGDDAVLFKLVMLENLDLEIVKVHLCYGHDGDHSAPLSLLPTFSGSVSQSTYVTLLSFFYVNWRSWADKIMTC